MSLWVEMSQQKWSRAKNSNNKESCFLVGKKRDNWQPYIVLATSEEEWQEIFKVFSSIRFQ